MSATILQFPSPAQALCAGLPREAVVAPDWEGNWARYGELEIALFEEADAWTGGSEPMFVLVITEDRRVLSALVSYERPDEEDVERLLSWLHAPKDGLSALGAVDDPPLTADSLVLRCLTRWGVNCGCATCDGTPTSDFACTVAAAAVAFVAMNGGPSPHVNGRLMALMPRWVEFITQAESA